MDHYKADGHDLERFVLYRTWPPRQVVGYLWELDGNRITADEATEWLYLHRPDVIEQLLEQGRLEAERQEAERIAEEERREASRIQLEPIEENDDRIYLEPIACNQCGKPAEYARYWPGCSICGGIDCGDSADVEYWCRKCAERDGSFKFPEQMVKP